MTTITGRLRALDGLRGALALYILLGHTVPFLWLPSAAAWLRPAVSHGLAAVDLFFVLSGLVILRSLDGQPSAAGFLIARAGRLLPVYGVALVLAALVLAAGDPLTAMPWLPQAGAARDICEAAWPQPWLAHLAAHLTMTHGLWPRAVLPDAEFAILGPAWSLSTEWQFYAVIAGLLAFGRSAAQPLTVFFILLGVAGAALDLLPLPWQFGRAFLPHEAGYFALGIASYGLLSSGGDRAAWRFYRLTLILLCLLCVAQGAIEKLAVPLVWTVCILGEAMTLSWGALPWPGLFQPALLLRQILTRPLLLWFGRVSYPLYLIHAPIQRLLMLVITPESRGHWWAFSVFWIMPALGLPILAAWALHHWVETPCWRASRGFAAGLGEVQLPLRRIRLQ
ncbi:acyltransferase family protein [Acidisoma cladoniae]|uniref:acyltransferase family protein n=1 Tax=Acidisoma cladoniae TaxID=3040935 RepID=UPI00254FC54A|nr:acyltransferase [Acidisoma sp. PAMC 29798]